MSRPDPKENVVDLRQIKLPKTKALILEMITDQAPEFAVLNHCVCILCSVSVCACQ